MAKLHIQDQLRQWIITMSRSGHDIDTMLTMMEQAGYGRRQSRQILAKVLNRPAIAMDVEVEGRGKLRPGGPRADGSLRTTAPEPPFVEVDGRRIRVSMRLDAPVVRVLHNVLDEAECDALIELARPRMNRALTVDSSGAEQVDIARTSSGMFFGIGETPLIRRIEQRLADLLAMPVSHGEALQVLHYGVGQEYQPHQDWFDPELPSFEPMTRAGGQRVASVVMYLNTPEAGGGTHFPRAGLTVAAHKGDAVYFAYETGSDNALHAGLPVRAGEKWIATRWLRERPYHKPEGTQGSV